MSENKRNYVRRKKYLNDCYQTIAQTLQLIKLSGKLPLSDQQIKIEAMKHAQAIEAACWSPRMKLSSSEYEELTEKKTKELCKVLTQRYARASSPAQKQSEAVSDSSQELTRQNSGSFLGFQQNSLFFLQPYDESMASSTPPNPLPSSLFDTTLIKSRGFLMMMITYLEFLSTSRTTRSASNDLFLPKFYVFK